MHCTRNLQRCTRNRSHATNHAVNMAFPQEIRRCGRLEMCSQWDGSLYGCPPGTGGLFWPSFWNRAYIPSRVCSEQLADGQRYESFVCFYPSFVRSFIHFTRTVRKSRHSRNTSLGKRQSHPRHMMMGEMAVMLIPRRLAIIINHHQSFDTKSQLINLVIE